MATAADELPGSARRRWEEVGTCWPFSPVFQRRSHCASICFFSCIRQQRLWPRIGAACFVCSIGPCRSPSRPAPDSAPHLRALFRLRRHARAAGSCRIGWCGPIIGCGTRQRANLASLFGCSSSVGAGTAAADAGYAPGVPAHGGARHAGVANFGLLRRAVQPRRRCCCVRCCHRQQQCRSGYAPARHPCAGLGHRVVPREQGCRRAHWCDRAGGRLGAGGSRGTGAAAGALPRAAGARPPAGRPPRQGCPSAEARARVVSSL